ncbi:MAG TPA: transporter substrate-binding domain-containing protein [Alphaproteobacteria bacterium]|nr:amino acid ABC transporter substrate-binding protein [Alphaproteobacteria bacterium]HOO50177.1 transporter substrate-binding domain-containing protein [Alphaproteobacteria bacterium]
MMRLMYLFVCFAMLSFPAFALDEPAYNRVVESGVIRCGYAISPPVMVKDPNTGVLSGLDVDLWTEIGKELGLKIEWAVEVGWGSFIEDLRSGRVDAFCSSLWSDPARAKFLSLTSPLYFTYADAYVRADDFRFDGDLSKINDPAIKIPAVEGDVSVAMAQNGFPLAGIDYLPQSASLSEMFMSVLTKKSDVLFVDQSMLSALDKNNQGKIRKVENVPHVFTFANYYGVLAGEYQLRDMINMALRTIKNDGRLEKLAKKYSESYTVPRKDFE